VRAVLPDYKKFKNLLIFRKIGKIIEFNTVRHDKEETLGKSRVRSHGKLY
jgi:hypothetical protein